MGNDLLDAIEKAAENNSREELDLTINIALSMVPTEKRKKKRLLMDSGELSKQHLQKTGESCFSPFSDVVQTLEET